MRSIEAQGEEYISHKTVTIDGWRQSFILPAKYLHYSALVITLFSVSIGLFIPCAGYWSDHANRKMVIIPIMHNTAQQALWRAWELCRTVPYPYRFKGLTRRFSRWNTAIADIIDPSNVISLLFINS